MDFILHFIPNVSVSNIINV